MKKARTPVEAEPDEYCGGGRARRKKGGKAEGGMARARADRPARKAGGKWIQSAVRHPGALHEQLGVPKGEKIPEKKLEKAANSDNPTLRRRAKLAETLKGFH